MKCLSGVAPLSLLMFAIALPTLAEGKEPTTSAAGQITAAPVSSAPTPTAQAGASASASAAASATAAASSAASAASAPNQASVAAQAAPAAPAASTPPTPPASMANAAASATQASAEAASLHWKAGPREIALLDQATVKMPQDFAYLEQDDARQLLRKLGNPNIDDVNGLFSGPGGNWLLVVRFSKSGYIKDDEVPDWKLDELLGALRKNLEQTNAIRKKNGVAETEITGWIEKPNYDAKRHRLVWAISSADKGAKQSDFQSVNFNMVSFGREGFFNFNLVTGLAQLDQNKKYASTLVSSVVFKDGKKYRDFKKGLDKLSPFTIAGLVATDDAAATDKPQEPVQPESKLVRFIKVFGVILFSLFALAGVAFGIYQWMQKKRAAKLEAEVAAAEAAPAK